MATPPDRHVGFGGRAGDGVRAESEVTLGGAEGSKPDMSARMAELVELARDDDQQAFDELVTMTYQDTYTLALRLTSDPDDARDVTQDTYLRAYKGLAKFRGDAAFSTWLYRITANCAANQLNRRRRHRHQDLDDVGEPIATDAGTDPAAVADAGDLRDRLSRALDELPPKLRAVVVLRDVYELGHEAVADELDISTSAAKVRLHRARRKLRDRLFREAPAATGDAEGSGDDEERVRAF